MFEIETNVLLSCFFNIIFEYSLSFINMLFCSHLVKKKKKFMYCRFSSPTSTCCFFIFFRRFFCILKTHAYSIRSKKKEIKVLSRHIWDVRFITCSPIIYIRFQVVTRYSFVRENGQIQLFIGFYYFIG
jgi:hypothetical protein